MIANRPFYMKIFNLIHRLACIFIRFILVKIHGEKGDKVRPVNNLILLDPATVLAKKIRTREITSVEVLKAFIERIKVCIRKLIKLK